MKYKRRKTINNHETLTPVPKKKKEKTIKKFIFGLFLLPVVISILAGASTYKKDEITKGVAFLKNIGKDVSMYVSEKLPSLSKVGKKAAEFCFEYIRGEKKESMPVISTLDSTARSLTSIAEDADKSTKAEAASENLPEYEKIHTFSPVMPCNGEISSPFGERVHPLSGEETSHNGIDIAINSGTRVFSIEDGTVQKSEYNQFSGNFVVIAHQNGYTSSYAHLSEAKVKTGDSVKKGDIIGVSGSTGAVTGPHLHMEIRKDSSPVDPMSLIKVN